MKNSQTKSGILLDQQPINQTIMMKTICKYIMSKDEAIHITKNSDLKEKSRIL